MIEALAPIFAGELAPFGEGLVLGDDPRHTLPGSDLLEPDVLADLLARFGRQYAVPEPRGVASQWSKWHFSVVVTPVVIASLLADHHLPAGLEEVGVVFAPEWRTAALKLPHGGRPVTSDEPFERFRPLVDGHLDPLIRALALRTGASPRVFWSNAGNIFENVLRRLEARLGADRPGMADGHALLASRHRPDGRPNPLFEPVRYADSGNGPPQRRRRVCCIRYLIPSLDYCSICPLLKSERA